MRLTRQALRDLDWWVNIEKRWQQRAIWREATSATLFSDASMRGWGGVLNQTVLTHGLWTKKEREQHITELELLAVLRNVECLLPRLRKRRVLVLEDNSAVVWIFHNHTSRQPRLMALLRETCALCDLNDITLAVRYVSTHANLADIPSRYRGRDHWRLTGEVFKAVEKELGVTHTVDRFATKATTLLPRWNSPHPEPGSEGVDGLACEWLPEVNWVHPPPSLLTEVVARVEREPRICGTVVTPYWPAEAWFATLHRHCARAIVVPHAPSLVC